MGLRYKGGLLSVNAPTISQAQAPGVWSQTDVTIARAANTWPINGIDPYFKNTTLLLHGDQTSNFLTDLSPNIFTVTPNGNPQSSQFTPFFGDGYYSNYLDGSSNLITPSNTAFGLGTIFCIEAFVYPASFSSSPMIFDSRTTNEAGYFNLNTSGIPVATVTGPGVTLTGSTALTLNAWNHLVMCSTSGGTAFFLNGTRIGFTATQSSWPTTTRAAYIGADFGGTASRLTGYFSNYRVVKGSSPYDPTQTTITVPTAPLTAITNTSLLTCEYNRFKDGSSNNFTITTSGTPKISAVSPFANPSTGGSGAGYFGGSDSLSVADNAALDFASGSFTVEFLVYLNSTSGTIGVLGKRVNESSFSPFLFEISSGAINFQVSNGSSWGSTITSGTLSPNTWYHIAGVRDVTTTYLYVNGTRVGTNGSFSGAVMSNTSALYIAQNSGSPSVAGRVNGYISNVRLTKGGALYTPTLYPSGFTFPTSTLSTTVASGTVSLLTLTSSNAQNNNVFQDSSQNYAVITRNGTPTQGTLNPFGNLWSNYFDGSSYIAPQVGAATFTGDFTIDCFVYDTGATTNGTIYGWRSASTSWTGFILQRNANNNLTINFNNGAATITQTSNTYTLNTWHYVALTRSGTTVTLWVDGLSVGTATVSGTITMGTNTLNIGVDPFNRVTATYLNGYVSNLRVVTGSVLNVATIPTTPLSAVSGTALLTCQSNRFIDNSLVPQTLTLSGTPKVQNFSPFAPPLPYSTTTYGGSGYFPTGSDNIVSATNSTATGDFTIDMFVYMTVSTSGMVTMGSDTTNRIGFFTTTGTVQYNKFGSSTVTIGNTIPLNAWSHVAIVRSGSTITVYVNGQSIGAVTLAGTLGNSGGFTTGLTTGYAANVRFVNGYAVYTGNFTPPTALLQMSGAASASAYASTTNVNTTFPASSCYFITNFTNGAIIDNTVKNDLITAGDTRITTAVKQFGTGSMFFDGTGDWASAVDSPNLQFGTGNFTIEFWVNSSTSSSTPYNTVIGKWSTSFNVTGDWSVRSRVNGVNQLGFTLRLASATYLDISTSTSLNDGAWHFCAVVRNGTTITLYIDGLAKGSGTVAATDIVGSSAVLSVGGNANTNSGESAFIGYLDDVRITKGIARYTGPTCPVPAVAFPNQ